MQAFIKKISIINKNPSGFSLVELLIAMAISGLIAVALTVAIFQLWHGQARSSGEMVVVRQVQQAGYHISRDVQMATGVSVDDDLGTSEIEIITLNWYWYFYDELSPAERDGEGNRVIYTLEDDKLYRNYYFAEATDPPYDYVLHSRTFIAEHIKEINCAYDTTIVTLMVTASVDGIAGEQEETRIYEAKPRPNVF